MPPIYKRIISNIVNRKYIPYNHFAVLDILGTNFPLKGPGDSFLIILL